MEAIYLKGKYVFLREWQDSDLPKLYEWRNSFHYREFCSMRKKLNSFEEFQKEFLNDIQKDRPLQCMICLKSTNESIGTIYAHDMSRTHGNATITTFLAEEKHSLGYGAEAFTVFCAYVIQHYALHKIVSDVYSHNIRVPKMLERAGFIQEGYFKEHRRNQKGDWLDIIRLSLFEKDSRNLQNFAAQLAKKL